jgi:hypothetical protein
MKGKCYYIVWLDLGEGLLELEKLKLWDLPYITLYNNIFLIDLPFHNKISVVIAILLL